MKIYFLKYVDEITSERKKWQKEIKTTLGIQQGQEALLTQTILTINLQNKGKQNL